MHEVGSHFRKGIPEAEPMEKLAQFIVSTDYEDLCPEVVEHVKKLCGYLGHHYRRFLRKKLSLK